MPSDCISYRDTHYFSSLICDYLDEKSELHSLYHRFPKLENFEDQISEKTISFNTDSRLVLNTVLIDQYESISMPEKTKHHIDILKQNNTFTVTTGHQLNLFTGPLYFLYKIISTINLTVELKGKYPEHNFVPVYWMATEDHDFDEINYFNFRNKKVQWSKDASGPVGRLSTEGLNKVFEAFSSELDNSEPATYIKKLFKESYLEHDNLADATRYVANALFGGNGLVILDADDSRLKRLFIPIVEKELFNQVSFKHITETSKLISELSYKVQVNPREINLFYIKDNLRERIIEKDGTFYVNETTIKWSKDELLEHLTDSPECFSPNALLRPLYQEVVLPNLCYIGGGGELAYWFQLKDYFKAVDVTFPMLLLRNSALLKTQKQSEKLDKIGLTVNDLFLKQFDLVTQQTKTLSEIDLDFSPQKKHLKQQFEALYKLAEQTDKSFLGAVGAQEKKQLKGLNNLEKRLLKAQKRKLNENLQHITNVQDDLFPRQSLQERNTNFSEFYLEHGSHLIPALMEHLKPLDGNFTIIQL